MSRSATLDECRAALERGEVVLLPTDTVYGLAATLDDERAVAALYAIKGRPRSQPCQVLVFGAAAVAAVRAALPEALHSVLDVLLPGATTCIVPDRTGRFAAAAGAVHGSVGVRAPRMDPEFGSIDRPLIATSANDPGGPDPRRVGDVPERVRDAVGAIVDRGELPGVASAVVDLRTPGVARIVRPGPEPDALARRLGELGLAVVAAGDG